MVFGAPRAGVRSAKGINFVDWSLKQTTNRGINDMTDDGSIFVAVGNSYSGDCEIWTSSDGDTWTERTCPVDGNLNSVAYGNSTFVAVGVSGANERVVTSTNGTSWTSRTFSNQALLERVVWDETSSLFYALGSDQTSSEAQLSTSPDGITWTKRSIPGTNDVTTLYDLYRSEGTNPLIAIGKDQAVGSDAEYIYSANGTSWSGPNGFSGDVFYAGKFDSLRQRHYVILDSDLAYIEDGTAGNDGLPSGTENTIAATFLGGFQPRTRMVQVQESGVVVLMNSVGTLYWTNDGLFAQSLNITDIAAGGGVHYGFDENYYAFGSTFTPDGKIVRLFTG